MVERSVGLSRRGPWQFHRVSFFCFGLIVSVILSLLCGCWMIQMKHPWMTVTTISPQTIPQPQQKRQTIIQNALQTIDLKRRPLIPGNTPAFYQTHGPTSSSDVAVVSLIGGINPSDIRCLGFFYNVLVTAQRLQDEHSTAELVVLLQLSPSTNATTLPDTQISALEAKHIRIFYIPKPMEESFHDAMLDKFRILDLIQYKRVLYLDADAIPLSSLDLYLRDPDDHYYHVDRARNNNNNNNKRTVKRQKKKKASASSTMFRFRSNIVTTSYSVPSHGGFFVLTPGVGEYQLLLDIVQARIMTNRNSTSKGTKMTTEFDVVRGWGHIFTDDDPWMDRSRKLRLKNKRKMNKNKKGRLWSFHGASSDQGLLYYWTKYVKQNVSIIFNDRLVENWGFDATQNRVVLQETLHDHLTDWWDNALMSSSSTSFSSSSALRSIGDCYKFVCDMAHFTGRKKPWYNHPIWARMSYKKASKKPQHLWWYLLRQLNKELNLKIDFDHWPKRRFRSPPLGSGPQAPTY